MGKSIRGKYWHCKQCRDFFPDENDICDNGHPRYEATSRSSKDPGVFVHKIPPGLQGDKMYIHRQNGLQVLNSLKEQKRKKEFERVKKLTAGMHPAR